MADVTLTYKGATIAELNDSGSKTLRTAGKFCEADIGLTYEKAGGGASLVSGSFTLTEDMLAPSVPYIETGIDFTHILVYLTQSHLGYGHRSMGGLHYWTEGANTYGVYRSTNSGGTAVQASSINTTANSNRKLNSIGQKVGTRFNFLGDSSWPGYYNAGLEFKWVAW